MNIAEILKDKPQHTKLYSTVFGECELCKVPNDASQIKVSYADGCRYFTFNYNGNYCMLGECVLFPSKEMRDWEKFDWKKGDELKNTKCGIDNLIFDHFTDDSYEYFKGKYKKSYNDNENYTYLTTIEKTSLYTKVNSNDTSNDSLLDTTEDLIEDGDIAFFSDGKDNSFIAIVNNSNKTAYNVYISLALKYQNPFLLTKKSTFTKKEWKVKRLATYGEQQLLFDALKKEGLKWNAETKEVESVKMKYKFKPFDKVVVRDSDEEEWRIDLFSHVRQDADFAWKDYKYQCLICMWRNCLPYNEDTAKLIGTTNNY